MYSYRKLFKNMNVTVRLCKLFNRCKMQQIQEVGKCRRLCYTDGFHQVSKYEPPVWAKSLSFVPEHRVKLAMLPTPITRWGNVPDLPEDVELYIKRDDLTGCDLTGSKVRKLEFILGKALAEDYSAVITSGRVPQTNHGRSTAVAARQLGLDCHLVFGGETFDTRNVEGGMILNCFVGSKFHWIPGKFNYDTAEKKAGEVADSLAAEGKKALTVGIGGSDINGLYG